MATERNARGICGRCGWEYPLARLRREYQPGAAVGLRVCPTCFDSYNYLDDISRTPAFDQETLDDPSPDPRENMSVFAWAPAGNMPTCRASCLYVFRS